MRALASSAFALAALGYFALARVGPSSDEARSSEVALPTSISSPEAERTAEPASAAVAAQTVSQRPGSGTERDVRLGSAPGRTIGTIESTIAMWSHVLSLPSALPPSLPASAAYVTDQTLPDGRIVRGLTAFFLPDETDVGQATFVELQESGAVTVQVGVDDGDRVAEVLAITKKAPDFMIRGRPAQARVVHKGANSPFSWRYFQWTEPDHSEGKFVYYVIGFHPDRWTEGQSRAIAQSMKRVK